MKASNRNQAASVAADGSVFDIDMQQIAPAGSVPGFIYPNQSGHETLRYRPAQVKPDGSVVDLDGRVLAPANTITFTGVATDVN